MGYQALLFCPDEKVARVVSQVFAELDFSIEPVHEPFAAVKKLMAQRYDAIVVDCENEQNASLLFKSARNSSSNQSSLAIAVVEGQAGVAKAYRIGANLVLTKPINVEQAKGTLRVARGLLRKNQDAAGAPTSATAAATAAKTSEPSASSRVDCTPVEKKLAETAPRASKNPAYEATPLTVPPSISAVGNAAMSAAAPIEKHTPEISAPKPVAAQVAEVSASNLTSAAAVAPAKVASPEPDSAKAEERTGAAQSFRNAAHSAPEFDAYESVHAGSPAVANQQVAGHAPTFALDHVESESSQGNKKFLIAACLLVLAVLGYSAYQKFGNSSSATATEDRSIVQPAERHTAPQANVSQPSVQQQPVSPQPANSGAASSLPVPASTPGNGARTALSGKTSMAKTSTAVADNTVRVVAGSDADQPANSDLAVKIANAAPVHVKSSVAPSKRTEDIAPPSSSSFATTSDNKLSGLMASTTASLPKPALASLKVSQGVSQGLLIKRVAPQYPAAARSTHTQGEVRIEATVNKEGMVVNPKVIRGDTLLAHAAMEAIRQWRYKPYYLDGQPVEIQTEITINFKAD